MSNLKQYVRDTIKESIADYDGDIDAVLHDALMGTNTGWWNDLIYYHKMVPMALEYKRDIMAALNDYEDATGEPYKLVEHAGDSVISAYDIACALCASNADQIFDAETDKDLHSASTGLQFAVEWLAHSVAHEFSKNY